MPAARRQSGILYIAFRCYHRVKHDSDLIRLGRTGADASRKTEERRPEDQRRTRLANRGRLSGKKQIDADLLEELEYTLISADIGVATTEEILERIRERVDRKLVGDSEELRGLIREYLLEVLVANERPLAYVDEPPAVIMVVGVNGAGKTTTIGKLTAHFKKDGHTVMMCAADTFRAAAIEQLEVWGERTDTAVIRQKQGADPSAVVFDALAGRESPQNGLRDCGYRRPPADENEPDGGTRKDAAYSGARDTGRPA